MCENRYRSVAAVSGSIFAILLAVSLPACATSQPQIIGLVPTDWPVDTPGFVAVPLPADLQAQKAVNLRLDIEGRSPTDLLAQVEPADCVADSPARAWFTFTANKTDRGKKVAIRFSSVKNANPSPAYQTRFADPMLHVSTPAGEPILSYHHGKPEPGKQYPLTSYIHPLMGLDGETLTALRPPDHIHHRGLYWTWVRHERAGKLIGDWWQPKNIHLDSGDLTTDNGPVFTRLAAEHLWVHETPDKTNEPFVAEHVVCRVFETTEQGRAIDVDLTLTALEPGVRIGGTLALDKGYGGMTLRFNKANNAKVEADTGPVTEANLNHLAGRWVDWTGIFDGPDAKPLDHRSGAGMFVHPTHPPLPASPPEWITRYYGPVNVAYPGMDMIDIPPDKPLRLRYRVWIHRGDASQANVAENYQTYAADWQWTTP